MSWTKPKWRYVLEFFIFTIFYILFSFVLAFDIVWNDYQQNKKLNELNKKLEEKEKERSECGEMVSWLPSK